MHTPTYMVKAKEIENKKNSNNYQNDIYRLTGAPAHRVAIYGK